jgi:hypothetical protein
MFAFFKRLVHKRKRYTERAIAEDFVQAAFDNAAEALSAICSGLGEFSSEFSLADRQRAVRDLAAAIIALEIQALPNLFPPPMAGRLRSHVLNYLTFKYGEYAASEVRAYEEIFRGELKSGRHPGERVSERLLHRLTHKELLYGGDGFTVNPISTMFLTRCLADMCGVWKLFRDQFDIVET